MHIFELDFDNTIELPDFVKVTKTGDFTDSVTYFTVGNTLLMLTMGNATAEIVRTDLSTGKQRTKTVSFSNNLCKVRDTLALMLQREYLQIGLDAGKPQRPAPPKPTFSQSLIAALRIFTG